MVIDSIVSNWLSQLGLSVRPTDITYSRLKNRVDLYKGDTILTRCLKVSDIGVYLTGYEVGIRNK